MICRKDQGWEVPHHDLHFHKIPGRGMRGCKVGQGDAVVLLGGMGIVRTMTNGAGAEEREFSMKLQSLPVYLCPPPHPCCQPAGGGGGQPAGRARVC